jgi:hypothetical protein
MKGLNMEMEDEDSGFEPDALGEDNICADCGRLINGEDLCGICGSAMCFGCFEMGCGVCKGPHR